MGHEAAMERGPRKEKSRKGCGVEELETAGKIKIRRQRGVGPGAIKIRISGTSKMKGSRERKKMARRSVRGLHGVRQQQGTKLLGRKKVNRSKMPQRI